VSARVFLEGGWQISGERGRGFNCPTFDGPQYRRSGSHIPDNVRCTWSTATRRPCACSWSAFVHSTSDVVSRCAVEPRAKIRYIGCIGSPWSRYDRHFVGITRYNAFS